jgi:Uncharacterized protein conserved in bacteria
MRVLILTADYDGYLQYMYRRDPALVAGDYAHQTTARVLSLFGASDFYSSSFKAHGHDATELVVNNIWMQTAWAREHGIDVPEPPMPGERPEESGLIMGLKRRLRPFRDVLAPIAKRFGAMQALGDVEARILLAQIEHYKPDVILNQEVDIVDGAFLRQVRAPDRTIIAQCGVQPLSSFDGTPYSFGISLIPWVVEFFRSKGIPAYNTHLGFGPAVLERLGPPPKRDVEVSFVGGLSSNHKKRIEMLEAVASELPVQLWLSSFKGIPSTSPLHQCVRGEAWGRDMYDILRRSKITLNSHIDAARGMAGNMRLYEATGVGTFLLTDNLPNLPSLFEPGVHLDVYDDAADCVRKVKKYLAVDAEREEIAAAGQAHTLSHHTFDIRVQELLGLIEKHAK